MRTRVWGSGVGWDDGVVALGVDDLERVRVLWRDLCVAPDAFRRPGVAVVEVSGTRSGPPGAVSAVVLGDAAVVAGPGVAAHDEALTALGLDGVIERARLEAVLGPFGRTLGPAALFYGRTEARARHEVVGPLAPDAALVRSLLADATDEEIDESSAGDLPSGVYMALDDRGAAAAGCGWHEWPHAVAHIGVLAAASNRGRGYAASAAAVALTAASASGLIPQWRAALWNAPSIALAARLGLMRVGTQFGVLPA
jgi:RimJ/RimL family protein N-acetyltransferase